jgi:hypothetical protein
MHNTTGVTGLNALAQQLVRTFDRNKDGQLSTEEFTSVLSDFVQRLATADTPNNAASSANSSTTRHTDHLSGFVPEKLESSQSIKYKFGRAAMEFDLSSVKDKASAEALLNEMKPAMEREGLEVLEIKNDKIRVRYEGQPLWVDVIRGASSGNTAFQWLPEGV